MSFQYGIHFCLGAALARMEGRIALEETFKRRKAWTVDLDGAVRLHTSVRGWVNVPVLTFMTAPPGAVRSRRWVGSEDVFSPPTRNWRAQWRIALLNAPRTR